MPTFTRVKDLTTGHHYDLAPRLLAIALARGAVEVLPDYPVLSGEGAIPRPATHFVAKDGTPSTPHRTEVELPPIDAESADPVQSEGETA